MLSGLVSLKKNCLVIPPHPPTHTHAQDKTRPKRQIYELVEEWRNV